MTKFTWIMPFEYPVTLNDQYEGTSETHDNPLNLRSGVRVTR